MNRRGFLALVTAVPLLATGPASAEASFIDYQPGVIEDALSAGRTVFVDYAAWWCTTCRAQHRVIDRLVAANPAYQQAMLFVRVDWDDYGDQPVARDRNIPRRSTLLVLRGDSELGRIVAGTSEADIKALMDIGL
jgi:thioredoxin 1